MDASLCKLCKSCTRCTDCTKAGLTLKALSGDDLALSDDDLHPPALPGLEPDDDGDLVGGRWVGPFGLRRFEPVADLPEHLGGLAKKALPWGRGRPLLPSLTDVHERRS